MTSGLTAAHLTLARGARVLVRDLSLGVAPGECLMLRGANGAGKTTLLLALAGILRPAEGTVAAEDLHLLGHLSAVKPRLTVAENLNFWCALYAGDATKIAPALERVGLAHASKLEAGHLSAGQTRRLAIARLLVAPRNIWLLDEPTAALDAAGAALVAALIGEHLAGGGLAVVATHDDIAVPPPARVKVLEIGA